MSLLNPISFSNFKGDLFGGLTAAIVSLPLALTFGVASGAGAEAGLYGAMLIGLFASLFGGTSTLISEPTGPMTVIMAAVISQLIASNPEQGLAMAFSVVIMAGLFQILFGVLGLGRYITQMPYSVVSGFMSGIGVILILMQLAPATGQDTPAGDVVSILQSLPVLLDGISPTNALLAVATLLILFATPKRWARRLPPQLIALVFITLASVYLFNWTDIKRIGAIDVGLPQLLLPAFSTAQLQTMVLDAMVLGMLGCIDSMLTSMIADNLTKSDSKANKELVGQGLGNVVSGLFGGLPGAGATMGTVVNIQAGGRTVLSGVVRVAILAVVVFGASGLLEHIPLAVLAAIAVKVGIDILDWSFIKRAHNVSWQSALIMYGVMLLTVLVDLIVAVGVGVFVANILIIDKLSRSQSKKIKAVSDMDDRMPLSQGEKHLLNQGKGKILMVYLSGPMIFGVAKTLAKQHERLHDYKVMVMDLTDVSFLDDTIALAIENSIEQAAEAGVKVQLVIPEPEVRDKLVRMGVLQILELQDITQLREQALSQSLDYLGVKAEAC